MKNQVKIFLLLSLFAFTFTACDDDEPVPVITSTLSSTSTDLMENASSPLTITVTSSVAVPQDITVSYNLGGTAIEGTDYEAISDKSISLAQGQTSASITIDPIDNNTVETSPRTIVVTLSDPNVPNFTLPETPSITINLLDDDGENFSVSFEETIMTTNEYNQDTVRFKVTTNFPYQGDLELSYSLAGTGVAGTNFTDLGNGKVTIPNGERSADIEIVVLDTDNQSNDFSETIEVTLESQEGVKVGANPTNSITVINPVANTRIFALDEDFARIYAYNTYSDVMIPSVGRKNTDPTTGTVFDESFAFTYYDANKPNNIGFASNLWNGATSDSTRSTNILNMNDLYGKESAEGNPGTVDENVSSGSAGLRDLDLIRLIPNGINATSGKAVIEKQSIKVYRRDDADGIDGTDDDEIHTFFFVEVSGEGTYDESTGLINMTITFDETSINNGVRIRRFEFNTERRPS